VGDFNRDSYADLVVGVPYKNIPPNADAGQVAVLYGSAAGLQANAPDDQVWNQGSPDVQDDPEANDLFGISVVSSDFNADGFADLAVGVVYESVGSIQKAGCVQILYGSASGLQAVSPDDQLWTQDSPHVLDQAEPQDEMGWWVT